MEFAEKSVELFADVVETKTVTRTRHTDRVTQPVQTLHEVPCRERPLGERHGRATGRARIVGTGAGQRRTPILPGPRQTYARQSPAMRAALDQFGQIRGDARTRAGSAKAHRR